MSRLYSGKTGLEEQCEREARRDGCTRDLLDCTRQIVIFMRLSKILALNLIKNLLLFPLRVAVYRPAWQLMMVVVKRLESLYMFPMSVQRQIKRHQFR